LASAGFCFGALMRLTDTGGADFAHGGVAGTLAGAPHVPTGDAAVGAPALAEGEEFLGLGHVLLAVGDGPAFLDAEVMDGEDVGATEAKDQEHFDGPGTYAADRDETFDKLFVRELLGLLEGGDDAVDGFLREVLHGEDFGAGEAGFAKRGLSKLEHFLGSGNATIGTKGFDAAEDRGGGFAGDGLVSDSFDQSFVRRLGGFDLELKRRCFFDQPLQAFIAFSEVPGSCGKIERKNSGCFGHGGSIPETGK
jgi:hypothetical protein